MAATANDGVSCDDVLSHHHSDRTGGLLTLRRELAKKDPKALSRAYVGLGIFLGRPRDDGSESNETLALRKPYELSGGTVVEVAKPTEIFAGAWLTGPVPRTHPERNWSGTGRVKTAESLVEDTIPEDLSLVLDTERGLVVVSGCGHAGIVNTLEYARKAVREGPVHAALRRVPPVRGRRTDARLDGGQAARPGSTEPGRHALHRDRGGPRTAGMAGPGPSHLRGRRGRVAFDLKDGIRPGTIAR